MGRSMIEYDFGKLPYLLNGNQCWLVAGQPIQFVWCTVRYCEWRVQTDAGHGLCEDHCNMASGHG